ncbi:hypothetical protein STRAU_2032 [Streptomyces aurantiacus JA 4570]|uniref:Uncharacterized protein n=1 Tax=Streptomyces aurantiacus JA 4570 TaxID=1286094 RepID=S4ATV5_9ACTN|nr:hypothetical protein STRAU_2032 [Streptomyces aurantiacus JA 4570]
MPTGTGYGQSMRRYRSTRRRATCERCERRERRKPRERSGRRE